MRHWNDVQDKMSGEPCSPSMACDMEEVCSKVSKKMKDMEDHVGGFVVGSDKKE